MAHNARNPPEWPLGERIRWLRAFRAGVAARRDELVGLCAQEVHKSEWEALSADILPLLSAIKWHEKHAKHLLRRVRAQGGAWWTLGQSHRVVRAPLGTVGIIATWNYPVQLLGVQMTQALAAGNRVVVKPSERAPRTQGLLLSIARDAGLPDGMLEWTEATREAGAAMLRAHGFDHVVFTGSTAVGREVARWAAETLTATTLELSGRDSALVLADADVRLAARSIWHGATTNGGQTCMAPRRALVERGVYDAFVAELAPLAGAARPRRLIDALAAARVEAQVRDACARGGRSVSGVLEPARGEAITPVAVADCPEDAPLVEGDHFGPALAVVAVESIEHGLDVHGRRAQHLATSVFTRSKRAARDLEARLGATTVTVNDCLVPTGHPGVSISGVGLSGWGESRGAAGLLAMSRPIHVSRTPGLRPSVFEPGPAQRARFDGLLSRFYGGKSNRGSAASDRGSATINRADASPAERVPSESGV